MSEKYLNENPYEEELELDEINRYENLSPAERIDMVASILAVAVTRYRQRKLNKNNMLKTTQYGE